jgi:putative peptidoglycan lipid II flippase
LFKFNLVFIDRFIKIIVASILMGIFFNFLINFFNEQLMYSENFKAIYLISTVIVGFTFYIFIALLIKAFKKSDINLNY